MFTKVSVLVPTRNRLDRLSTMLDSYERTTMGEEESSELVFRVDDDDLASKHFLSGLGQHVIVGPRLNGYHSMFAFFNEMAAVARGDVLMLGNDDMVFQTVHWAPLILDTANQYPDGLFDIGVSTFNEDHFPFATTSKRVVEALGFIWDPQVFWGDMYLRDVMNAFGRCVKLPSVRIDHDWMGFHPDQTFVEGDQQAYLRKDPSYWSGTHVRAVESAVEKLRGLYDPCLCTSPQAV